MRFQVSRMESWFLIMTFAAVCANAQDLSEAQREAFRISKTATIVVEQAYGEATGVNLPFETLPRQLLGYAGLQVLPVGPTSDLTLRIVAKGKAEAATYRPTGGRDRILYTGAALQGTISMQAGSAPAFETPFAGKVKPPEKLQYEYPKGFNKPTGPTAPSHAPFRTAYDSGSFEETILSLVFRVYGGKPLALAWLHADFNFSRRKHVIALLKSAEDSAAVDVLTAGLKDKDPLVRERAANGLEWLGDPRAQQNRRRGQTPITR